MFYKERGRAAWAPRGADVDGLGGRLSVLGGETGGERLTGGVDGYRGFSWPYTMSKSTRNTLALVPGRGRRVSLMENDGESSDAETA